MTTDGMLQNRTFDEISVSDSATLSRVLSGDDLALATALSGDPPTLGRSDGPVPPGAQAIWCGGLATALFDTCLPGPGTTLLSNSIRLEGALRLGTEIVARATVRERRTNTHSLTFDWQCADSDGARIASGTAEVIAPVERMSAPPGPTPEVRIRRHDKYLSLIARCRDLAPVIPTAVVFPCDESSLSGAVSAAREKMIAPILVGPESRIRAVAEQFAVDLEGCEILDAPDEAAAAKMAVGIVRSGKAELLMKGSLHTDEMMSAVVNKELGLRTERRISHCFIMDVPNHPKPLIITDAAINIAPTLTDKVAIVQNAIDLARVLGLECPRVAILSAVETINEKIATTIEAAALCKMAERGQIVGGILDGPLALDNAISKTAARIKGIVSPVAGEADILLVPDLEAGNMLAKNLTFLADADAAGIVLGARVPIILTSRADAVTVRMASCAVAALYAHRRRMAGSASAA